MCLGLTGPGYRIWRSQDEDERWTVLDYFGRLPVVHGLALRQSALGLHRQTTGTQMRWYYSPLLEKMERRSRWAGHCYCGDPSCDGRARPRACTTENYIHDLSLQVTGTYGWRESSP